MDARGADLEAGRRLIQFLRASGLVDVQSEGRTRLAPGGSVGARMLHLTLQQARQSLVDTGAIDDEQMGDLLSFFQDPNFVVMLPLMMAARGRRPPARSAAAGG
jgi:hypothetical protein